MLKQTGGLWRIIFCFLFYSAHHIYALDLPEWFLVFRDAVYEQAVPLEKLHGMYRETKQKATQTLSGPEGYAVLAACESLLGQAYLYENRHNEAVSCFARGAEYAQGSIDERPTAEGYMLLSVNIGLPCLVRPTLSMLMQALQAEAYAKKAVKLDSRNVGALYFLAARYIYAPLSLTDYRKGIRMLEGIVKNHHALMRRDEQFNVYSALAYAYFYQNNFSTSRSWLLKAADTYPSNKFIRQLQVLLDQQNMKGGN
jgi:tetratricopeptide (TPR) repeat protein